MTRQAQRPVRVLVAEDDFLIGDLIEGLLAELGYTVAGKAATGREAVEMTCSLRPDVVLMDVRMPELDGMTAVRLIQETCPTPVVILTAYDTADLLAEAANSGVTAYLTKPPSRYDLNRAIVLSIARAQLEEARTARLRLTEALLEIARATSSTLDLREVLKIITRRTALVLGASRCSISLWQDGRLVPAASRFADGHKDPALWEKFRALGPQALDEFPTYAEVIRTKRPVVRNDVDDPRWLAFGSRAVLMVPLLCRDAVLGTLHVDQPEPHEWTQVQIELAATIANQAALTVENARLYEQTRSQLRELQATQAQLLEASKLAAVGQLVAGVAHELNNPLTVVSGHAELLHRGASDPRVIKSAERILDGARRAAKIVADLQIIARPRLHGAVVQLDEILARVVAGRRSELAAQGIRLEAEIAAGTPPVWGDAQQLEQVALNLLVNAEHAVAAGGGAPRIEVRLTAASGRVRLVVSDAGPGIPPEIVPRIFEPFFTTKPPGQGMGLGLSICYRIVEAHRGSIWAESAPARGATFVVELPAHSDLGRDELPTSSDRPARLRRGHVLVIDDEAEVAETLRAQFEHLGQQVTVAVGGREACDQLAKPGVHYDLVTLDLKMPEVSGAVLWERLVASGSPLVERLVFLTGDTVDEETRRFLEHTGRPVLAKPVWLANLADLLARVLPTTR